jgi:soluble lytic murein transglycosylase-like protein
MIAKLLFLPLLAAAASLAPVCGVSANSIQGARASIPQNAVSITRSEFEKEQAMSPSQLMDRWTPLVEKASHRFGVSVAWIQAVMRMESGGRTLQDDKRPIISDAGAMGIMQIMPETYREMRRQYGLGADPYNPHDNVMAGTAYLRWLYGKYGYPKMFAAYNAGPGALEAQFAGLRRLPDETRG